DGIRDFHVTGVQTCALPIFFVSSLVMGQTQPANYVQSTTYQVETLDGETQATNPTGGNLSNDDKIETITYYDGLGRPKQSISKQIGRASCRERGETAGVSGV